MLILRYNLSAVAVFARIKWLLLPPLLCFGAAALAQTDSNQIKPSSPRKVWAISAGLTAGYSGAVLGLNYVWYAQYPRQGFHLFNDWAGWRQMDKVGHAFTTYAEARIVSDCYRWAGLSGKKSAYIGTGAGLIFQSSLELLDGFSQGWGFSWGDMGFNAAGAGLFLSQELLWQEQRIRFKYSFHPIRYPNQPINSEDGSQQSSIARRSRSLFGSNLPNRLLKDYNGQTIWLSANLSAFIPQIGKKAAWLNLSAGYSVENLLGAERNRWAENGVYYQIPTEQMRRHTQLFLSLDVDWERIPTQKRWLKMVFKGLNWVKIPFPALEINSLGQVRGHWLYF